MAANLLTLSCKDTAQMTFFQAIGYFLTSWFLVLGVFFFVIGIHLCYKDRGDDNDRGPLGSCIGMFFMVLAFAISGFAGI